MNDLRITPLVYSFYRVLLGSFLIVHFAHLLPYAAEVFSNSGMLPDAADSPLFGIIPNILAISDSPLVVQALAGSAALAAVALTLGWRDRVAAVWIWCVLACLFARNPLIANPSLPLVGWMVLAHAFVPPTPIGRIGTWETADPTGWRLPRAVWISAWVILAISYSYSGYTKLLSPSWVAGDNVSIVLNNPLARDYFLREWLLALPPWTLKGLTWFILVVELLFAPLALIRRLRPWLWSMMLFVQFGFLFLLNFPDLTFPMLLIHLLTFDPNWVRARHASRSDMVFYDGNCGLCHGVVRRILAEDQMSGFKFAPLSSDTFESRVANADALPDSFVVLSNQQVLTRSRAAFYVMSRFGGLWGLFAWLGQRTPQALGDALYDFVGRHRMRLFARPMTACPIVPTELRQRFMEA